MKNLFLLLLTIMITSCATTKTSNPVVTTPIDTPIVSGEDINIVTVDKYTNFTQNEKTKIEQAEKKLNTMLGGDCFKNFMLDADLIQTNNRTNIQVVDHLKSSHVNIELIIYYKYFSKVHGYTYPNVNKIWFNRKYHSGTTVCAEASNLMHELSHKFGYGHDYKATSTRPKSVPYTLNRAVKACCI